MQTLELIPPPVYKHLITSEMATVSASLEVDDGSDFTRCILMMLWCDLSSLHTRLGSEKLLCGLQKRKSPTFVSKLHNH